MFPAVSKTIPIFYPRISNNAFKKKLALLHIYPAYVRDKAINFFSPIRTVSTVMGTCRDIVVSLTKSLMSTSFAHLH